MTSGRSGIAVEGSQCEPPRCRVTVFAPHPDDEVIGAFSLLTRFHAACFLVFVTDGAPLKLGKNLHGISNPRQDPELELFLRGLHRYEATG
jgi:LmbE family N-acetylglucosaminyl deacetylase